ncbi:DNA polymerase III subunit delta' [Enterococcus sp. DIV0242_7C1]|uniref:DNA polymerase III, delta' subunit n=1 Tax=Candidatus Enterococcus dunnyi TaxID=1834192 RepID=A0A200JBR7_9ENTE|nr:MULTISPECIES: DNA polymerase III subunit delta' [unclassified Enterococcus]MBO0471816.1 DNA polymerase III subunit delta' [Enterococcus sp. DIV0242_7C1]OUZ34672.1 DNA polymerase III, delta' subunit [Enterococcus sp. 9D6_DIV0238]
MNEAQYLSEQQPLLYQQLQKSFEHGRLAHAYLFEGDTGTGKKEFGLWMAKHVFCTNLIDNTPCNQCNNCLRINDNEHPDVLRVAPDGQTIKVDQIRALKAEFSKSGVETAQKVFLIEQADKMSIGAANSLLKFLEEPEGKILAILETTSLTKILPTIQSRCQVLHFQPLVKEKLIHTLTETGISKNSAALLAELTNSFDKAVELSKDEWFNEAREIMQQWFDYLIKDDLQAFVYVQKKMVKVFKEKEQQALSFDLLLAFYRKQLTDSVSKEQLKRVIEQQAQRIELILKARQKWEANVSWQSVCEQLVIRMIHPKT